MLIERAVIEINGGCNYSCQMCPQTTPGRDKGFLKKMPLNHFESYVKQCVDAGASVINLEGSGEPTLNRDLPEYIKIVEMHGAKAFMFTNGRLLSGKFMKDVVDAGIDFIRFSIIGYDDQTYRQWMNSTYFKDVIQNLNQAKQYIDQSGSSCDIATYHLILDDDNIDYEVEQYLKIVTQADVKTEVWKMHNWSGVYNPAYVRDGLKKTCGRPFSPDVVIRAGGIDGKIGAVHPCCQVLGRDKEAVLGHLSEQSLQQIWNGRLYEDLREAHRSGNYPEYCKDCDFLINDPNVLVYTNFDRELYKMYGTAFSLDDFR